MEVTWTVGTGDDRTTEVVVRGDVDMAAECTLYAVVSERIAETTSTNGTATSGTVALDLSEVAFMDSAGLRTLMRLHLEHPRTIVVRRASAPVRRLFEIAGVADWLLRSSTDCVGDGSRRGAHEEDVGVV